MLSTKVVRINHIKTQLIVRRTQAYINTHAYIHVMHAYLHTHVLTHSRTSTNRTDL